MSDNLFWCSPFYIEIDEETKTVYDLLGEYKCFLETYHSERCKSFHELCSTEPEAARAEAIVFSFFKRNGYDIQVEETRNEGGVDFRVQTESTDFVVEVTSILRETFTEHSGIPENLVGSGKGYYVGNYEVARLIRSEASSKANQMSDYPCPRVLVIACEHAGYSDYLKKSEDVGFGADMFLTSPPKIAVPGGNNVTYLEDSLFFRFQNDRIVFCRESISTVLLLHISKYYAETTGLLHPKPAYNFSSELLPLVPFVEILVPKIENNSVGNSDRIKTRWIPNNSPDGLFRYNGWC